MSVKVANTAKKKRTTKAKRPVGRPSKKETKRAGKINAINRAKIQPSESALSIDNQRTDTKIIKSKKSTQNTIKKADKNTTKNTAKNTKEKIPQPTVKITKTAKKGAILGVVEKDKTGQLTDKNAREAERIDYDNYKHIAPARVRARLASVLAALPQCNYNITAACLKANIGRSVFYAWKDKDPNFKEQVLLAFESRLDAWEGYLHRNIAAGSDAAVIRR